MFFKEDWEMTQKRFDAFWEGEIIDRCCIAVTAPRNKSLEVEGAMVREAKDLHEKWLDIDYRMGAFINECSNTYFGGEAYPNQWNNLGPGVMASFIGADYELGDDTVWFDTNPIIKDWNNLPKIEFDEKSEMWQQLINMMDRLTKEGARRYIVGVTDIGGNYDILASLRGTQDLLYDLYDEPEAVKEMIKKIDEIWINCYNMIDGEISKHQEGTTSWMPLWCRERWYPLQCDFSAMLSPDAFEEFVKPSLKREAEFLDKAIFHLDGPGELPHVDHLLDIDDINGIQWTPGAGNAEITDEKWYPLYKKIQEKGKNLVILGAKPEGIEKLLSNISSKGLFLHTSCSSEDEAKQLINKVEKWTRE